MITGDIQIYYPECDWNVIALIFRSLAAGERALVVPFTSARSTCTDNLLKNVSNSKEVIYSNLLSMALRKRQVKLIYLANNEFISGFVPLLEVSVWYQHIFILWHFVIYLFHLCWVPCCKVPNVVPPSELHHLQLFKPHCTKLSSSFCRNFSPSRKKTFARDRQSLTGKVIKRDATEGGIERPIVL